MYRPQKRLLNPWNPLFTPCQVACRWIDALTHATISVMRLNPPQRNNLGKLRRAARLAPDLLFSKCEQLLE
jgi:hypothetical protein